jgi:pentatricopeptide repeat protein
MGLLIEARNLFKKMPQRDVASWNAMIAGFGQNGLVDEALKLFKEMPEQRVVLVEYNDCGACTEWACGQGPEVSLKQCLKGMCSHGQR